MIRKHNIDPEEGTCSIADSSIDDNSRNSEIDTYSDRNSSSGLELLERAIHTLIVETRVRDLDREVYQDPDRDRYLIPGYQVFFLSPATMHHLLVHSHLDELLLPTRPLSLLH